MTLRREYSLGHSEYNDFLFAAVLTSNDTQTLPVLLAGTWLGLKLYGRLNEAQFRKVVLILLLASGVVLLFR